MSHISVREGHPKLELLGTISNPPPCPSTRRQDVASEGRHVSQGPDDSSGEGYMGIYGGKGWVCPWVKCLELHCASVYAAVK